MMNSFDMIFHLFEGTAVHLNYVAIKLTVIFTAVFVTALTSGLGKSQGIFTSIIGPTIFFIYYRVASSTLNRELFRIDEQLWYVVPHIIFFGFSYWLVYSVLVNKRAKEIWQRIGRGFSLALVAIALDFIYLMFRASMASGGNEEVIAMTLHAPYAAVLLVVLTLVFAGLFILMKRYRSFVMAILSGLLVVLFGIERTILHGLVLVALVFIAYHIQKWVIKHGK